MIDTLTSLLVPGGRSRISPYVQDAQLQVLFGEVPDDHDRHGSLRGILKRHDQDVQHLADTYTRFTNARRPFNPLTYEAEDFLRLYLAYYFTTNLSKIQLCLLDLVTANKLPSKVTIVDIGVGSGTTAVAVLDFLLAWSTTCQLFGQSFPVETLQIHCFDSSPTCLRAAHRVVAAFCEAVTRRKDSVFGQKAMSTVTERVAAWGMAAKWNCMDIANGPIKHADGSSVVLFASNVLNELTAAGKISLGESIAALHEGSIAVIIEPGDRASCVRMNTWRSTLLEKSPALHALFPCGDQAHNDTKSCCTCWNSRRESLHEPLLYRSLRERTGDPRSFDDYSNNLLSWSYTCLERAPSTATVSDGLINGGIKTRVFGMFRRWSDEREFVVAASEPDSPQDNTITDYLKLCPACFPGAVTLWAKRTPGFILPPIRHGAPVCIKGSEPATMRKPGVFVVPLTTSTEVVTVGTRVMKRSFLTDYGETSKEAIDEIAFRLFGFKTMRPFQHEILGRVLTGQSILGIAATGGGKSECYILPAMLFSGVTIVISPLKSLMQDQFEKRIDERYGLRNLTTYINGDVAFAERQARLKRIELGFYKLVYFTPEQLRQSHVMNSLKRAHDAVGIRYLALDEAHCISQWGHDFRDSYLNLLTRLYDVGIEPICIALTATASPEVRADLCEELKLKNFPLAAGGDVYIHSSNRAELNLIVKRVHSIEDKATDIAARLQTFLRDNAHVDNPDAAIVFMPLTGTDPNNPDWYLPREGAPANRGRFSAGVTNFASYLERFLETRVAIYHSKMDFDRVEVPEAGENIRGLGDLSGRTRRSEQTNFIDGRHPIMVATKGFGMGIDKPNVRLIIHRTPTSNLEAYAQESGRAGRDGEIADVVLYYSPDAGEDDTTAVRSDYDIQDFFLSQKYIRRDDVIAMKSFLASVKRSVCEHLYFTSDEILPFFDQLAAQGNYAWPDIPPRLARGFETREHTTILDRGHKYTEKIRYVDRILSALYRIRPNIGPSRRVCILESVQETGAILKCRDPARAVLNAEAIVNSNAYFGQVLRDKGLTSTTFTQWMGRCIAEDTVEFARALGLPLADTASMLWDINRSDGQLQNHRWVPALLDFLFVATPKYGAALGLTASGWRDYAGASRRVAVPEARRRAEFARARGEQRRNNINGQIAPTDDDWFGPRELPEPKGWEVRPGMALTNADLFEKYVAAFMEVHDRRQANDRAAYRLLLTDYVGANEDGSLPQTDEKKPCLRAVLLGYLKTGEVVQSNCGSCSRCVPRGNYERDLAKRKKAVERLGTEITDLLDTMEMAHSDIPAPSQLQALWKHVETMEAANRSFRAYVEGWTGRLLTDRSNHKTALLIRIDGMIRNILPMLPQEVCSRALQLLEVATFEELPVIWETVSLFQGALPDLPDALIVRAIACQRMSRFKETRDLCLQLLQYHGESKWKHKAHSVLVDLFDSGGPQPDPKLFQTHIIQAARTAPEYAVTESFYKRANASWSWSAMRLELLFHLESGGRKGHGDRLLAWWVVSQSGVGALAATPSCEDWEVIIDQALSWIELERKSASALEQALISALDRWADSLLQQSPALCPVRALRIALLADGKAGNRNEMAAECLTFLSHAKDNHRVWLSGRIESGRLDASHYSAQLVLAELAFRQGAYLSADIYWKTYIDAPPANVPAAIVAHVLGRLVEIHGPQGPMPDETCLRAALLARARASHCWEEAEPFYRELLQAWDAARLKDETRTDFMRGDSVWVIRLVTLWVEMHDRAEDGGLVLSVLNDMPKTLLDANAKSVEAILQQSHPREVARHPIFGPLHLEGALNVAKFIADRKSSSSNKPLERILRDMGSKAVREPTWSNKRFTDRAIEFLAHAVFTGLLDGKTAIDLGLPPLLFEESDDNVSILLARECGPMARDQIVGGNQNVFFHTYEPESVKTMDRWLSWFGASLSQSTECAARIIEVAEAVLKKAMAKDRAEIGLFMTVSEKHAIQNHVPDYPVIKAFVAAMADVEKTSDIASAYKLEGSHLGVIEHALHTRHDVLHADILVAMLRAIHRRANVSWVTPLSRLVEALVAAGRTEEALVTGNYPGLTVGRDRMSVELRVALWKGVKRQPPDYAVLLDSMARLYIKSWRFR